jgi:cytochrome c peroxidase
MRGLAAGVLLAAAAGVVALALGCRKEPPAHQPVGQTGVTPTVARFVAGGITREQLKAIGLAALADPPVPSDNPPWDPERKFKKVELGKMLFFDPRMSGDSSVSCSTCHLPGKGWGDGLDLSDGYPGTKHWRNTQTILNAVYYSKLFWGGEATSLEKQAESAWTGALGHNLDPDMAEERLRQIPEYVRLFRDVFGDLAPSFGSAAAAVAAFESTITSRDAPFDRYMEGDNSALSESALRGLGLFTDKAGCSACHSGPLFTDESYHSLGVPENPKFKDEPLRQITLRYQQRSRGVAEEVYRSADRDLGLYYVTKLDGDRGKFRTPSLREVTRTGPYMHNGVFGSLREVIEFLDRGGGQDANRDALLKPLGLSPKEIDDLLAFLGALSGDEVLVEPPPLPPYDPSPPK